MRQRIDLNGEWSFRIDRNDQGERQVWHASGLKEAMRIEVPHIWQREKEYVKYCGAAWYEKQFEIGNLPSGKRVHLLFGAVDFQARVWLNGVYLGEHEGGFTPFEFDATDALHPGKDNRLTVRVYDPQDNAEIPIGKQGSWYTRISGIWQEVGLEFRSTAYIEHAQVYPDIDAETAEVRLALAGEWKGELYAEYRISDHLQPEAEIVSAKQAIEAVGSPAQATQRIELKDAILWSPELPHLYELNVRIIDGAGNVVDEIGATFGMRKIEFADGQLLLNHRPLFVRGALDQAFYPDTIYVAPSDEYIRNEIEQAKAMGFNLLRKHIKVEIPRYLYWADRMGMLIWAEPPNVVKWSAQSRKRFRDELVGMIRRDFNHPSILIWSLYNEEWGLEWDLANDKEKQAHVIALYDEIKALDPTRLICDNSGWIHVKTDINDYHRYFVVPEQLQEWKEDIAEYMAGDPERNYVKGYAPQGEPIIVSEFGVWGLPSVQKLLEHYDGEPSWFANLGDDTHREDFKMPLTAYANFDKYQLDRVFGDFENLSVHSQRRMYRAVKSLIEEMRKHPRINGYVVTEFTDIEWETNGWMDYTRNLKLGMERAADFNGGLIVMADGLRRNLWSGEEQSWDIVISNHDLRPLQGVVKWEVSGTGVSGTIPIEAGEAAHVRLPGAIRFVAPSVDRADFHALKLTLELSGEAAAVNEEELTISPCAESPSNATVLAYEMDEAFLKSLEANGFTLADDFESADAVVTSVLDEAVLAYYREGGQVLFLAEEGDGLTDKGQFTFRELVRGESWDRTSSFNYVDPSYFEGIPLRHEMGWEMEGLYPDYIVPFSNYNKLGGTIGRIVYMFGNETLAESSEIVSGYFQGWIGQAGGSLLIQKSEQGRLVLTTWKLKNAYGTHPIATQIVNHLLSEPRS